MPGNTPQPGETPSGSDPWALPDPDAAWWRGETDRSADDPAHGPRRPSPHPGPEQPAGSTGVLLPPAAVPRTGEAAEAHTAGVQDVSEELTPVTERPPAAIERDHDQPDPHRYNPLRPTAGHTAQKSPETVAADTPPTRPASQQPPVTATQPAPPVQSSPPVQPSATQPAPTAQPTSAQSSPTAQPTAPQTTPTPVQPTAATESAAAQTAPATQSKTTQSKAAPPKAEPPKAVQSAPVTPPKAKAEVTPPPDDVMVLPEPSLGHRPTVPLDHPMPMRPRQTGSPHARPTEPLPPPTGSPATDARLDRLENSTFWRDPVDDTIEVRPGEEPPPALTRARHRSPGRARAKRSGRPLSAQVSLVALGLVAAFFAWVSAEPFWLAVGHGDQGYVTTTRCTGDGVTQRCIGRFASADGRYTITQVRLLGVEGQARIAGTVTPARMVSPDSRQAYVGGTGPLLQLRWILGFTLVLLCGYAIAGVTRARRLETARARRSAVLLSLAGPLALLAGFLAAAY